MGRIAAAMSTPPSPVPELSRPVALDSLGEDRETVFEIHPGDEERAALARRFGLVALPSLNATVSATRTAEGDVRLSGRLKAEAVQTCVVTLDPVPAVIDTEFTRLFSPKASWDNREEIVLAPGDEDPPDPLVGETVDAGEVAAETLGLALDPFPRIPGAKLPVLTTDEDKEGNYPDKSGAFAALAKLKERR